MNEKFKEDSASGELETISSSSKNGFETISRVTHPRFSISRNVFRV